MGCGGYTSCFGGGGFGSSISGSGGSVEVGIEGGFAEGIRQEGPRVGDEAGGVGEGERAGTVGVGAVEQEGEAAVVGMDDVGVAGGRHGGVEAKDGVGIEGPGREAPTLGGEEGIGGGEEVVGARSSGVEGESLGDELLAALEVARHQELLGDAHKPLRLPPLGGGRIHGARRGWQAHSTGRPGDLTGARGLDRGNLMRGYSLWVCTVIFVGILVLYGHASVFVSE